MVLANGSLGPAGRCAFFNLPKEWKQRQLDCPAVCRFGIALGSGTG